MYEENGNLQERKAPDGRKRRAVRQMFLVGADFLHKKTSSEKVLYTHLQNSPNFAFL
jgi:hypothetical protein